MFSKVFLTLAAVAVVVSGQSSSATVTSSAANATSSVLAGISPCVLACVIPAATLNGCSFTDAACVCASAQFQADATACLTQHCTAADIAAAVGLQASQCAAASITPTVSASTTHSIPFSLASSSASTTAASGSSTHAASATSTKPASTTSGAAASTTSKASAAGSLVAKSGAVAVVGAILAGVLAL
ncbi:hypothetical protein BDZ97DRAFT_1762848 [Flammula alnicola]|nr:hypothetical protein BDZ97DRAFT_1762848 [Flammula alnicola]